MSNHCASCGKADANLKACTACKLVKYCGVECQVTHRPAHKKACKKKVRELSKKGQVIEAVAPIVMDNGLREMPGYKFTVNLSDPDFSIRIEVCKTLVGVSILPREKWYKNFNLAELTNPTLDDKK